MKVTILGKYSPFTPANGAGPGYWVDPEDGGPGLLLDCGSGVLSRFQQHIGTLSKISVVILSHLHFDHMSDLMILRYAAGTDRRYEEIPHHLDVYAPSEPQREFGLLAYKEAVTAHAVSPSTRLEFGSLRVSFYPGIHPIPSCAVRIESAQGVFAYSGDTRPCPSLFEAARGADLFLCEASGVEEDAAYVAAGHFTARQAGQVSRDAGVKRLLLTHIWPLYDESLLRKECKTEFAGAELAEEGKTYKV